MVIGDNDDDAAAAAAAAAGQCTETTPLTLLPFHVV